MGPQNKDYVFSMNKKEKNHALKCVLSEKNKNEELIIIDSYNLDSNKTKDLAIKLKKFNFESALFVYNAKNVDKNFERASDNIPKISIIPQTLNQFNQYSFKVDLKSTALEIKQAIQNIFKVKVLKINTSIVRGKFKIFKGNSGYRKNYKKAVVTLKEGQTIDTSVEIK